MVGVVQHATTSMVSWSGNTQVNKVTKPERKYTMAKYSDVVSASDGAFVKDLSMLTPDDRAALTKKSNAASLV